MDGWEAGDEILIEPGTYCGKCHYCQTGRENYCDYFGIFGETEDGMQREFVSIEPKYLEKKPEHISFVEAAAFPLVFLTSYTMLIRRAQIKEGEKVLVLGATSGVGSAAIQIAKLFGCEVIATGGSKEKLEFARSLGADFFINHYSNDIVKQIRKFTDGQGVDVVFEHVGSATWENSIKSLAKGGRLVTCGATTGANVNIDLRHFFIKQQTLLGSTMGDTKGFKELVKYLHEKKLNHILDKVFPMSQVVEAHQYLEDRQQFGKIVLVPD